MSDERIGVQELADIVGQHPDTIRFHCRELGCPHERGPGKRGRILIDPAEYEAWRKSRHLDGTPGKPTRPESDAMRQAQCRKEFALAAKYELQVEKERARLMDRGECERIVRSLAEFEQSEILKLVPVMAKAATGLESGAEIQDAIDGVLRGFFDRMSDESIYPDSMKERA